jgi:cytochrome P450
MIKKAANDPTLAERSVISLGLKGKELTPDVLALAVDQMRTFIFAGYDTTASVLQWVYYFLSLPENSAYFAGICAEHDAILGPKDDFDGVKKALMEDPPMPYTTAVFKEALRLNPPASSARWVPPWDDDFFLTQNDGSRHKVNGSVVVISHRIIQNSRKVWGPDAKVFRPTRWLDKEYMANIPTGAFRPFERGPRACIGQELSHIESKIALGLTLRHFQFKHVVGEVSELGEMWNGYKITGQPYDGMKVTVKEA